MVEVSEATFGECADEVEGEGGAFVGAEEELWVWCAISGSESGAVDDIAAVAWESEISAGFGGGAAGFGILTGDASDADDAASGATDQDEAHLNEHFEFAEDGGAVAVIEAFGAVAALEDEGISGIDLEELGAESVNFPGCDEWRELAECTEGGFEMALIGVIGLLESGFGGPGVGGPGRHVRRGFRSSCGGEEWVLSDWEKRASVYEVGREFAGSICKMLRSGTSGRPDLHRKLTIAIWNSQVFLAEVLIGFC